MCDFIFFFFFPLVSFAARRASVVVVGTQPFSFFFFLVKNQITLCGREHLGFSFLYKEGRSNRDGISNRSPCSSLGSNWLAL